MSESDIDPEDEELIEGAPEPDEWNDDSDEEEGEGGENLGQMPFADDGQKQASERAEEAMERYPERS